VSTPNGAELMKPYPMALATGLDWPDENVSASHVDLIAVKELKSEN
jgi:hypothetical protein